MLWHIHRGRFIVDGIYEQNEGSSCGPSFSVDGLDLGLLADACTWTQPKVKREGWVNIYPANITFTASTSHAWPTQEDADEGAGKDRITCIKIEWEEIVRDIV